VNRIISIALILLMSLQCLYKLGVITYFQLNQDFIAEVLCVNKEKPDIMCHGQCFLDKNLEVADSQTPEDGTAPVGKQNIDFPVFIISESQCPLIDFMLCKLQEVDYDASISSEHTSVPFHPPAVLC